MEKPSLAVHGLDWVPGDACTLPTVERPLRVAEFDELFATTLRDVQPAPAPTAARLLLVGDGTLPDTVQRLADAEASCCSFFTFTVTRLDDPVDRRPGQDAGVTVALDIEVPASRVEVLGGLLARARALQPGSAA